MEDGHWLQKTQKENGHIGAYNTIIASSVPNNKKIINNGAEYQTLRKTNHDGNNEETNLATKGSHTAWQDLTEEPEQDVA